MDKIKKYIYIIVGLISFAIGGIGAILPIIPTTPFLLLASYCFVKGSQKYNKWFKSTKIYRKYLENFVNEKSMTSKQKMNILMFSSVMLAIPFVMVNSIHMRIFLVGLIIIKYYYFIFEVKTINN